MRFLSGLLLLSAALSVPLAFPARARAANAAQPATPQIRAEKIASPAPAGAIGPSLAAAPDGTLWLSWLEPLASPAGTTALRFATLAPDAAAWSAPRTIATGAEWFAGSSDFPALTVGTGGRATAFWYVNNPPSAATAHLHHGAGYRTLVSQTTDHGATWSKPAPLSAESDSVEFVSLATLADGRVLATWLDGRAKKAAPPPVTHAGHGAAGTPAAASPTTAPAASHARDAHAASANRGPTQRLYSRVVGAAGPDVLVDASVCDCCQTTLTAFPDGTALLAYRGRTDEEVRDMRTARFRGSEWDDTRPLSNDDWRIAACPVNGPQLVSDGGRVGAAWFTASEGKPRVLASFSPDAGARFLMPLRIDGGQPTGRVDTLLLHDGALLVTWVESNGALWLRRVTPDFALGEAVALTRPEAGLIKGFPRLALRRDYRGGDSTAQVAVTFTTEGANAGLHTLLVTVPEGALVAAEKNCDCAPSAEQLQGFSIRGSVAQLSRDAGTVRVRHFEVPGIFSAGTREFTADPAILTTLETGRQFLGRVEQRDGAWRLFDVRVLAGPPRAP